MRRSIWLLAAMIVLVLPVQAHAAFPGQNGRIAFHSNQDGDFEIYSINPDGTGLLKLTDNTAEDLSPSWSPDGKQIVFTRGFFGPIWKMNADGSGQVLVTPGRLEQGNTPSWTTNDQQIVFSVDTHCEPPPFPEGGIYTVNADGSNVAWLTCGLDDGQCCTSWSPDGTRVVWSENPGPGSAQIWLHTIGGETVALTPVSLLQPTDPDWSPSGHKIIFTSGYDVGQQPDEVRTMNPDGTDQVTLRLGRTAVWSPDGTKIAFTSGFPNGIWTAKADGSGATFLTAGDFASWQPIPINYYPRPKGATPFRASLTTAYQPCVSPDRQHGPPLASPSCSSPDQTSAHLTVGTGDSNQLPARNEGHLLMRVQPGIPSTPADEADVQLEFFLDDVFTSALADYTGELRARVPLQITDKDNTPHPGGPGAATTVEIPLQLVVGCKPVDDPQEGSACAATTSADALAPGTVKESRRSIWALGRVEVYDGGADGDAHTPAGDTLFATQGVFIP